MANVKILPVVLVLYLSILHTRTARGGPLQLYIVVLAPLPDRDYDPAFDQGHSLIPAVQLAVEHINNSTNILPGYCINIQLRDSGCDKATKTAVNVVSVIRDLLVLRHGPLGVIGPACSADSVFAVNMFHNTLGIPVFYSGTTPLLSKEYDESPNAFGMVSSTTALVDILIRIGTKERWNWKNVASLYDDTREHFQFTHNIFINSTQQIGYSRLMDLSEIPLDEITERNIRIVIVFASKEVTRRLLCLSGQSEYNFVYPIHQFIFIERLPEDVLLESEFTFIHQRNRKMYRCNKETVIRGMNGSIFLNQALDSIDPDVVTVSNYTVRQIKEQYTIKLAEYETLNSLTNLSEHLLAYPYYDAAWALALGLHLFFKLPNPSLYEYLNIISSNVSFQGVSTWIDFSDQHHVINPIRILQADGKIAMLRGQWNRSTLMYMSDTFISDEFKTESISVHLSLVILVFILISVLLIVTVVLQMITVIYRNYPSVKAGSAQLNHFIYLGCYLYIVAALSDTIYQIVPNVNVDVLCNINIFSSNLGFSFIFGTTLAKSWRTYRIFHHVFKTATGHHYVLHDATLATLILIIFIIEVVLFIPGFVLSPLKGLKSVSYDNNRWPPVKQVKTECFFPLVNYFLIPFLFQLCLAFAAIILATLNRNVKRKYFETTKQILMLVYVLSIMWAIGGPLLILSFTFDLSLNVVYPFSMFLLVATVVLCLVLLIVPSLRPIITGEKVTRFSAYLNLIRYSTSLSSNSRNLLSP